MDLIVDLRAPPPSLLLLVDFSPKLVLINESGRRHGSIACYPSRTTWEIRERYVTISNRI